jgi:archaeosortase A (PGF-CTERM-specific)
MDYPELLLQVFNVMLWGSLLLLVAASVLPEKAGRYVAALGWALFGLHWGAQTPNFYANEHNIMYTVACLLAIPATLYAAFILVKYGRKSLMVLTRAAAISSIFYFPFASLPWLGNWLIGVTTDITFAALQAIGQPVIRHAFDTIILNAISVQIILACTAIQSIAIFVGVVGSIRVEWRRWIPAFVISVPVIYVLNLFRDIFVIYAYGNQLFQIAPETVVAWTGEPEVYASFFWAHNVVAETGSLIALVIISYVVMSLMPELLVYLKDVIRLVKPENIGKMLKGEEVAPVPLQQANQ